MVWQNRARSLAWLGGVSTIALVGLASLVTGWPGLGRADEEVVVPLAGPGAIASVVRGVNSGLAIAGYPWYQDDRDRDSQAQAVIDRYLARLKAIGSEPANQGIWLAAGRSLLAQHQGVAPLSAASLTKLGTSLAALMTWGTEHQFVTEVLTSGYLDQNTGTLTGDLVIRGGGDPFFVWEEAIALGNALNRLGLRQVTGNLVVTGDFAMNFLPDPQEPNLFPPTRSAELLQLAWNSSLWPAEVTKAWGQMPAGTARPQVTIAGKVVLAPVAGQSLPGQSLPGQPIAGQPIAGQPESSLRLLVRRRSLPLIEIVKQMNVYSNNFIAESLGRQVGGPAVIIGRVAQATGLPRSELQPINGSGLDVANRWSARAIATILFSLASYLEYPDAPAQTPRPAPTGSGPIAARPRYSLADLLAVSGHDLGTLLHRTLPPDTAVKTGSLASVSALAGVLPTRDRGPITFAIINGGSKIVALRQEQERFLQDLQALYGPADPDNLPPELQARSPHLGADRTQELQAQPYSLRAIGLPSLGDPQRNELAPPEPRLDQSRS